GPLDVDPEVAARFPIRDRNDLGEVLAAPSRFIGGLRDLLARHLTGVPPRELRSVGHWQKSYRRHPGPAQGIGRAIRAADCASSGDMAAGSLAPSFVSRQGAWCSSAMSAEPRIPTACSSAPRARTT